MLIEFSVENFKSFRDRTTLSLVAAARLHDDPALDQPNVVMVSPKLSLLKVAALYGANASGKSNLAAAFQIFRGFVGSSTDLERRPMAEPFLLSKEKREQPSVFEIVFTQEDAQWRYGFAVRREQVVEEWLFVARSPRETMLFEREGAVIRRGVSFRKGSPLLESDGSLKRPEALFLSLLAEIGVEEGQVVAGFILNQCRLLNDILDERLLPFTSRCMDSGRYASWMKQLYHALDLGFDDIRVRSDRDADSTEGKKQLRLETVHRLTDSATGEEEVIFPLQWESAGTQKIVALSGPLADTLAQGRTLFADELDARLHPRLTEHLVSLFQSKETNPKNAQLIFVTHDTNLLDSHQFRRDQVWFISKDRHGASKLYSLGEFKGLRKNRDFEEDYLAGRFGALPFLHALPGPSGGDSVESERDMSDALR